MRTLILASLRRHRRRYISSALAVVIGVAFVVVTNALLSAAADGLTSDSAKPYRGADVVVDGADRDTPLAPDVADRLVRGASNAGASAAPVVFGSAPVSLDSGPRAGQQVGAEVDFGVVARDSELRWQQAVEGRLPLGVGEAAIDAADAESVGIAIGDRLAVGGGTKRVLVEVVGTVAGSSSHGASVYLTWDDARALRDSMYVVAVAWRGAEEPIAGLAPEARISPAEVFIAEQYEEINNGIDVLGLAVLVFLAIAVFVSVMVIANTFSILFAQRAREFALMRCVGLTKRQLIRTIRAEAALLGLVSSGVGVLVGMAAGLGLVALINQLFPAVGMGEPAFSVSWIVGALALGFGTTMLASWWPTRTATRTSPIAALRPAGSFDARGSAGRLRIGTGVIGVLAGTALLILAASQQSGLLLIAGGAASFLGTLLVGPVLFPAVIAALGLTVGRASGSVGRVAVRNANRNPRRTATTAASLLVGVTLTSAMLTGLATSRSALDKELDGDHPLDYTVASGQWGAADGAAEEVAADLRQRSNVAGAVALTGVRAEVGGAPVVLVAVPGGGDSADVVRGEHRFTSPAPGEVWIDPDLAEDLEPGGSALVAGQRVTIRIAPGLGSAAVTSQAVVDRLATAPGGRRTAGAIWVRASNDADTDQLAADLAVVAQSAAGELTDDRSARNYVMLQVDVLTGAVVGLLGIGIIIALVGIANTLGLSVLERLRENSLLRALGLTRRQLRAAMTFEGLLLSGAAALVGTVLGIAYAWAAAHALLREFIPDIRLDLPWLQLSAMVIVASLAGLCACVLPARRAALISPAQGLSLE